MNGPAGTSPLDHATWTHHAWRNRLQTAFLLGVMAAFLGVLGWLLWGDAGVVALLAFGMGALLMNPALSPRLVMRLYGARPLAPFELPEIQHAVGALAEGAGLRRVPTLYYVPSRVLNAFAVGAKDQAAVAVSDGLLRNLSPRELIAVLAHEISHVRSNDVWVMGLADLISRATSLLSLLGQALLLINLPLVLFTEVSIHWLAIILLIFAPSLSALAQLALSRTREYEADLNAARLTGDPLGLAQALARIERVQGGWMEQVFLPGRRVPEPSLLRTHPDTQDRIDRLMALVPHAAPQPFTTAARIAEHPGQRVHRAPRWHVSGLWH